MHAPYLNYSFVPMPHALLHPAQTQLSNAPLLSVDWPPYLMQTVPYAMPPHVTVLLPPRAMMLFLYSPPPAAQKLYAPLLPPLRDLQHYAPM